MERGASHGFGQLVRELEMWPFVAFAHTAESLSLTQLQVTSVP